MCTGCPTPVRAGGADVPVPVKAANGVIRPRADVARVLDEGQANQAWNEGRNQRGFSVAISRSRPVAGEGFGGSFRHLAYRVHSAAREARKPGTILPRQDACLPAWLVSRWAVGRGVAGELGAKLATAAVQARFDAPGRDAGYR